MKLMIAAGSMAMPPCDMPSMPCAIPCTICMPCCIPCCMLSIPPCGICMPPWGMPSMAPCGICMPPWGGMLGICQPCMASMPPVACCCCGMLPCCCCVGCELPGPMPCICCMPGMACMPPGFMGGICMPWSSASEPGGMLKGKGNMPWGIMPPPPGAIPAMPGCPMEGPIGCCGAPCGIGLLLPAPCPPSGPPVRSSLGTTSNKKSKMSVLAMAADTSLRCSVRRLFSSACLHAFKVSSKMNISHAFAKSTGASALIMRTSSSLFIIFFIRARGS
mmetsp:Transcript_6756/g.18111  ORF Transcript_6756/g.18111 Transcript_6756/m.18111 type:complete len:275 (+) Transcript_6756:606-1430(+)